MCQGDIPGGVKKMVSGKVALISMGCVQLCSKARAIRILQGRELMVSQTVYSYDITDMDYEQKAEFVKDLKETPKQAIARRIKVGVLKLTANFTLDNCSICNDMINPIFKNDGECTCGINKHHYHCSSCGCLTQIG